MSMGTAKKPSGEHEPYVLKAKAPARGILGVLYWIPYGLLFGLGGLFLIVDGVYSLFADAYNVFTFFMLILGLLCFRNFMISLIRSTRKCLLDSRGITVVSFGILKKAYAWPEVSSIIVCDANYASSHYGDEYDFLIRMAIGEEPHGPLSANQSYSVFTTHVERWRSLMYARNHHGKVLLFEYTPEKHVAIQTLSGRRIINCISRQAMERFTAEHGNLP